ncbi:MAG: metal-binding protein [Leptolyngbya sp. SIO4C1]|nr:metal-binding protein [Leptolyngbya sp. SIO4C1]
MADTSPGRVVLTHSTHVPGLIPVLRKLALQPQISTVTPAVIRRVRSHAPQLRLKVSVPTLGGFKLIARKGKTAQEVFVITTLSQPQLEAAIRDSLR